MPIRSYWPRKRRASRQNTEIDLVHNRINQLGRRRKLGHVLTETRASSAMALQGDGTYVERYGPRTNLCVTKDFTALISGNNTIITHMPLEPGMDGKLGNVYRVQFAATVNTNTILAGGLPVSEHTILLNYKKYDAANNKATLYLGAGGGITNVTGTDEWQSARHVGTPGDGYAYLLNLNDTDITDMLFEEPMVIDGDYDGPYIETNGVAVTVPAELSMGQGVSLQVSQAVTNYVPAPDMTGAVVGVPGTMPIGWTASNYVSGVQREIVAVGERDGLPTIHLRFFGQWDAGHPGYSNISMGVVSSMPITENDQIAQGTHIALVGGSLGPVSNMNLNAYFRLSGAYKGQTSTYLKNDITSELKRLTAVDSSLSPTGGTCDAAELALYFHVPPETPFDFTIEIAAPFLSPVAFVPPVNIGSGTTTTRAADNPVVVQGLGDELVANGDFADDLDGWEYDGSAIEQPYAIDGILYIPREVGATFIVRQQIADDLIIGNSYFYTFEIVDGGLRPRLGTFEDNGSYYAPGTTQYPGVYGVPFVATSTNLWAYFLPLIDNTTVAVRGVSAKKVFPYPDYNPDSQAYSKAEIQHTLNPIFDGTVGAVTPTGYTRVGSEDSPQLLAAETVGGILCQPLALRMGAALGYQGVGHFGGLKAGTHKVTWYARRPAGVVGERFALILAGGTPSVIVLSDAAEMDALPDDTWVRKTSDVTVTGEGTRTSYILPGGVAGQGFDLALPNIILDTTQDIETQSEQGAFSRILAGDGFASTVFPSAKDLVPGRFDSQADVDLWGPSSVDPDQMVRTEVDGRMEMVRGSGGIDGKADLYIPFKRGAVYALRSSGDGYAAVNTSFTGMIQRHGTSPPRYGIVPDATALTVEMWNWNPSSTVYIDTLSVQEVEPGVVIETVGVLNIALNQYVMWLVGSTTADGVIIRCRGDGFFNMIIKKDGATLFDITSSEPYTDGIEATIRLEITNTPDGCFFAAFKDGVVIPGLMAGPIAYPDAINTLSLIPVAGVKILKKLNLK